MKSKGQITVFIILGIIILFVVALAVYFQSSFNSIRPPVKDIVVSDEIKPIQLYVTTCLSSISKDALIRLGQNGGYITIPSGMHINPSKPYDSDVLFFSPQTIPYWYYMKPCEGSNLGCTYITSPDMCKGNMPCVLPYKGSNSMEEQLGTFVQDNLDTCLANFTSFKDTFDIQAGKMKVDVQITESTVIFNLDYPLQITIKNSNTQESMRSFYTEQDVKLKRIYQFAREIRDAEANYTFLERNTMNLITAYSGTDTRLPPLSGLDLFNPAGKKVWIRTEVKSLLMSDILPYTMLLQITNAGNFKPILTKGTDPKYIPFEEGFYKGMELKVSNNTYPDLNANMYYPPDADIYFKIGDSEIIKPKNFDAGDNMILKMMSYAVTDYTFKYDITYPVIVRIQDPDAFKGEGYTFNYALQANIRQNVPITKNMTIVNMLNPPTIDMEEPALRVNRTITVEAYDKYTKQPLEDVQITYKCGYETVMGVTSMNKGKAVLSDRFPFCEIGGEIDYEKTGYMGGAIDYTNNDGTDAKTFRIELWPLKEKKFIVYKRTEANINSIRRVGAGGIVLYTTAYTELGLNDTVFVNVNRIKNDSRETDVPLVGFSTVQNQAAAVKTITEEDQIAYITKMYDDNMINATVRDSLVNDLNFINTTPITEVQPQEQEHVMDFVPGKYSFDAFMMYDGGIIIPAKNTSICAQEVLGVCVFGHSEMNYPEENLSSWLTGGANINFTLTENDVYSNSTLIFFVAEIPLPTDWDTFISAPTIDEYQADKTSLLLPAVRYE